MFEFDHKNLKIKNKNIIKSKKFVSINITSDWAPINNDISDLMINKKEKYYGDLYKYFKKGDLNVTNLETVIDNKQRKFSKNALRFINNSKILNSLNSINTNLVCLANNHIMDNGVIGLKTTLKYLKKNKIIAFISVEALHLSKMGKKWLTKKTKLKNTNQIIKKIVRLPIHCELTIKDVDYISKKIKDYFYK